ncbi:hypothetical protein H6F86_20570 [Phormidium sp. FACHB-592]|uniref:Uncharacterized protein n=1 Tax=Stenomitos frigidus AS-A4 TaxID=2933935 RepID=A0ABV0KEX2_9CYAN|nr:hypothetical protein [Phormidium sp. FACHB-592]MBD2076227.1 hypothetical protein [Phormidium sp. FACHB-592]
MPVAILEHPITAVLTKTTEPLGLLPYLDRRFEADWQRFQVKNYGFQGAGNFDPSVNGSGYRVREDDSVGSTAHRATYTSSVLLGKIFPLIGVNDQQVSANVSYSVDKAIRAWLCQASGVVTGAELQIQCSRAIESDKNISASNVRAKWHVLIWSFQLAVYG